MAALDEIERNAAQAHLKHLEELVEDIRKAQVARAMQARRWLGSTNCCAFMAIASTATRPASVNRRAFAFTASPMDTCRQRLPLAEPSLLSV